MEYLVNGVKYATIEEAQEAEKKLEAEKAKKETALAEKKAELANLNEVGNAYLKLVAENDKKRAELRKAEQEAYNTYKKTIDDFAKKNQGYHLTYKIDGDNIEFKIEEVNKKTATDVYKDIENTRKLFNSLFNDFFMF